MAWSVVVKVNTKRARPDISGAGCTQKTTAVRPRRAVAPLVPSPGAAR